MVDSPWGEDHGVHSRHPAFPVSGRARFSLCLDMVLSMRQEILSRTAIPAQPNREERRLLSGCPRRVAAVSRDFDVLPAKKGASSAEQKGEKVTADTTQ